MDAGIVSEEDGDDFEFFCQVRSHYNGLRPPTLEVSHSFLWYWNAVPGEGGGWMYLDHSGGEHPLVRWKASGNDHQVEVRAPELKQYLHARQLVLLRQYDHVITSETDSIREMNAEHASEWAVGTWHCRSDTSLGERPSFSRLLAKAVLAGQANETDPHSWRQEEARHLDFQYGVDESSGKPLLHSSDPRQLGSYYDADEGRLHYLTPIYFSRSVLARYAAEPEKYSVTVHRLSCLFLWGVDISVNNAGLVEVYLGDIGERIPSQEWSHWKHHNVAPEGTMNEDRFRRDILNQPTSGRDVVGDLHRAFATAKRTTGTALGESLWRELEPTDALRFERLFGPTSNDSAALTEPVLTLTKALTDSLQTKVLRRQLVVAPKDAGSIKLLALLVAELGGDPGIVEPLTALHQLRSNGGIAHPAGQRRDKTFDEAGISGLEPLAAFEHLCQQLTVALNGLTALLSDQPKRID